MLPIMHMSCVRPPSELGFCTPLSGMLRMLDSIMRNISGDPELVLLRNGLCGGAEIVLE